VDQWNVGWGCAVNATAGKEDRWPDDLVEQAGRAMGVVVVGGGPAGLEAARIAALRGHRVTLLEARDELGGGAALWARLPGREVMAQLGEYFAARLPEIGVDVRTGVRATAEDVLALSPDVVVVATGSAYSRTGVNGASPHPIAGHDQPWVHAFEDVVRDGLELSGKVVVVDDEGYHPGAGVAELLAQRGATVELVSRKQTPAASLGIAIGYVAGRLRASGVVQHNGTMVVGIGDHEVSLLELMSQQPSTIADVDHVVLTTAREAIHDLEAALEDRVDYVYVVGDALSPRTLRVATYEGHRFGRVIGDADMPASVSEAMFDRKPWSQVPAAAPATASV
jgi:NADPH-dependent 2,4-dienoyl-CoA reductase/sulfur reductase-like enzyme